MMMLPVYYLVSISACQTNPSHGGLHSKLYLVDLIRGGHTSDAKPGDTSRSGWLYVK